MTKLFWGLIGMGYCLSSMPALARFQHHDAGQIDPVFHVKTETFNDLYSYRPPVSWQSLKLRPLVFYLQAGSLNVKRFAYERYIKAQADHERWSMVATAHQKQDQVDNNDANEVSLAYQVVQWDHRGIWLGLLADGDTFKEYGDLGVSLLWQEQQSSMKIKYWSIDHYYTSKKSDADASRLSDLNWTFDIELNLFEVGRYRHLLRYELSDPIEWKFDESKSYFYRNKVASIISQVQVSETQRLQLSLQHKDKEERLDDISQVVQKTQLEGMVHQVNSLELEWHDGYTDASTTDRLSDKLMEFINLYGLAFIERKASFGSQVHPQHKDYHAFHNEVAIYAKWALPLSSHAGFYHGPNIHFVRLRENDLVDKGVEAKWQLAFERIVGKHGRFFLNSTWDVDQLVRDAPFQKKPFRPWGGGDLQFLWSF